MAAAGEPFAEFIFHGTGTSGSVPSIHCLTAPNDTTPCETCISTLQPEGKKNIRRNTGAVLRVTRPDGGKATIIIDIGKNFLASALEWFPKYRLRRIDAILITHAHADAMNGLDDLRGWTLDNAIQPHIDIYVSSATFTEVKRAFPYLVSKEFASGGGDVPQFVWHTIEANQPFLVGDTSVEVTPFAVHHGRLFGAYPPPAWLPTPTSTHPSSPHRSRASTPQQAEAASPGTRNVIYPYICFGFVILDIVYMSDVSHIPEDAWTAIESAKKRPYSLFVVDCLRVRPHTSHFGLVQAVSAARRLGGEDLRTYMVGFGHDLPHSTWMALCKNLGAANSEVWDIHMEDSEVKSALALAKTGPPVRIKPAHDGLRLCLDENGVIFREDD